MNSTPRLLIRLTSTHKKELNFKLNYMNSIKKTTVTPTGVKINHFTDGLVLAENTKYSFTDFDKPIGYAQK